MSNILQQLTKNDPDLVKFDKLRREIGAKLRQTETDETVLKFQVINLAETLEAIMLRNEQEAFVSQIFTLLSRYFKDEFDISEKTNNMLYSFFEDYPQYTRTIVGNNTPYIMSEVEKMRCFDIEGVIKAEGSLPEENKLYRSRVELALNTLDTIEFSKLTKDQCIIIGEKISNLAKDKQHELEHNYKLTTKKGKKQRSSHKYDPYDDDAPETAAPGNKITQSLIKIRNQFNEMITQSQYMKFPSPELETELSGYFDTFYKVLRFITDRKHKASLADWSNMSLATNYYNSHYASSNIKFKAPLCATCKDRDEDLDPVGKKRIYQHIQMYSEYQIDRKPDKKGKPTLPPYIWRCPRCGKTNQKEEIMSFERINESLVYMNSLLIDVVNKSDIYKAVSIYFEELVKPQRLITAHNTSNKLLSKK